MANPNHGRDRSLSQDADYPFIGLTKKNKIYGYHSFDSVEDLTLFHADLKNLIAQKQTLLDANGKLPQLPEEWQKGDEFHLNTPSLFHRRSKDFPIMVLFGDNDWENPLTDVYLGLLNEKQAIRYALTLNFAQLHYIEKMLAETLIEYQKVMPNDPSP